MDQCTCASSPAVVARIAHFSPTQREEKMKRQKVAVTEFHNQKRGERQDYIVNHQLHQIVTYLLYSPFPSLHLLVATTWTHFTELSSSQQRTVDPSNVHVRNYIRNSSIFLLDCQKGVN